MISERCYPYSKNHSASATMAPLHISESELLTQGRRSRYLPMYTRTSSHSWISTWIVKQFLSCTLVSRTLLPCGRSKLFHVIVFKTEQSWALFKVFLAPSCPPHIIRYLKTVRELWVQLRNSREDESWSHEILVACSEYITGVKSIRLDSFQWTSEWRSSISSIPPNSYTSVQDLRVSNTMVFDVVDLYHLISAFPAISHLILWAFSYWVDPQITPSMKLQELKRLPTLHSLIKLELTDGPPDMAWFFAESGLVRHLKHLIFDDESICSKEDWITFSEAIDSHSLSSVWCGFDLDLFRSAPCTCFDSIIHSV